MHQYLAEFYKGNNGIYENSVNYFKSNVEALKQAIQKTRTQGVEIGLFKVSYEPPQPRQNIDFAEAYQMPIEVAIREIDGLKKILAYFRMDIDILMRDKNRGTSDLIEMQFYNESLRLPAQTLRTQMDGNFHFYNAIANIFENACVCLKTINEGYKSLRQNENEKIQTILNEMDEIYNALEIEEHNAFDFLRKVARYRLATAHDREPEAEQETQFIMDIISLSILNRNYLGNFLEILLNNKYESILKLPSPSFPQLPPQPQADLINVDGVEVNPAYEYEDIDINTILDAYVRQNRDNLLNLEVLGAVDNIFPEQLEARLRHAQENYRGRTLLIPYNLGNYHWAGLLVELDAEGRPRKAICCDPLGTKREALKCIEDYFKKVFPASDINYVNYLRQTDVTSCGAVTIDNLMRLARGANAAEFRLSRENTARLRADHVAMLRLHRPDYAEQFYRRQRENRPTVSSFAVQMAYQKSLRDVKFSAKEAEVIVKLASLIENLENQEIKTLLKQTFLYNDRFENNVKLHLDNIRQAIYQALDAIKSEKIKR